MTRLQLIRTLNELQATFRCHPHCRGWRNGSRAEHDNWWCKWGKYNRAISQLRAAARPLRKKVSRGR